MNTKWGAMSYIDHDEQSEKTSLNIEDNSKYKDLSSFVKNESKSDEQIVANQYNPIDKFPTYQVFYNDIEKLKYLMTQTQSEELIKCKLTRIKKKNGSILFKLVQSHNDQFLMCAKYIENYLNNYYLVSMHLDEYNKNSGYLGKLQSSRLGDKYIIYSAGKSQKDTSDVNLMREELGSVQWLKGDKLIPRFVKVIVPKYTETSRYVVKPTLGLDEMHYNNEIDNLEVLSNSYCKWDERFYAYTINFNGGAQKPSIKNFQCIYESEYQAGQYDNVRFQLGKMEDDYWQLQFRKPLSYYQAFSIALSSFNRKYID